MYIFTVYCTVYIGLAYYRNVRVIAIKTSGYYLFYSCETPPGPVIYWGNVYRSVSAFFAVGIRDQPSMLTINTMAYAVS